MIGLEPVQDPTRLLKGRRAYRAFCADTCPGSPSRGFSSGGTAHWVDGAPAAGARAATDGGPPCPAPAAPGPLLRTPQKRTTCQATLWTSIGNTFSLVSEHVFLFFSASQTTREGAGRHKCLWLGTLQESLAGKYTEESTGTGSPGMPPGLHHCRERQGAIRGCGVAQRPPPSAAHPLCHTHLHARGAGDLRLSRAPSLSSVRPAKSSPGMETHPVQARARAAQSPPGGRAGRSPPVPAGVPRHPGPLCNHPRRASGAPFSYRLRTFHGNRRKTSGGSKQGLVWKRPQRPLRVPRDLNMPTPPKAHFQLPGRSQRRRSSPSPLGCLSLELQALGRAPRQTRPCPPPGCLQGSVPTRRSIMSVHIHMGKKPDPTLLHMFQIKLRSTPASGVGTRWSRLPRLRGPVK